jgi:signal transduction histidine kinase/ActR/RegA family two-component response regulator
MTFQNNPAAIPFCIAALLSATLLLSAWRRRAMPAAPAFAFMMAGETTWALGEALELEFVELPIKTIGYCLRATGAMMTVVGLLAFVLRFIGLGEWLRSRWFALACLPAAMLPILAWTNPWHHWVWPRIWVESMGGYWIAMDTKAAGFWICVIYCYAIAALSSLLLGHAVLGATGIYRDQAVIMLFGVLLPWIVSIIDLGQLFGPIEYDLVVISFAVTGVAFLPGLFRYRLLDLTPVAWEVVVKGIHDPVVVIDPWGRIVELNPAAQRMVEWPYPKVIGMEASRAFGNWPSLVKRLESIPEQGESAFEIDGPDARIPSSFDVRISRFGEGVRPSGWVLVLRDIGELKRAEAERLRMLSERAARAEAEAASRAKDHFLATLSHELRTPLTPVLATATAMLDDSATPADFRAVLEMIRRNVVLETRLIDDLLDLSRIRQGKLRLDRQLIDAHELVDRVIEICWDNLQSAGLQLRTNLSARRHHLDADPVRLQQVLWNLLKNAIKFTPAGGTVTIRTRNPKPKMGAPDNATAGPGLLRIEVTDTGVGIERELLPRIFDMFEQGAPASARRQGGLGLGLTISRSIAEQHGGRLGAASAGIGQGATFTLELPVVADPVAIAPSPAISASPVQTPLPVPSMKILLVEDNADTLHYLSRLLTLRGHTVLAASSVAQAKQVGAQTGFELLISDIELPDGTGIELMWHMRSQRGLDVPGIALSGFGSSDDIEQSRAAGFAVHLTKPVDFRLLEQAVQQFSPRGQPGSLIQG